MTKQELKALWEYAEYLEITKDKSKLYTQIKEILIEELKRGIKQ